VGEQRQMISYPEFQSKCWQIGSGPTEATCKTLTARLKGSGMRWDADNAEAVMAVKALVTGQILGATCERFERATTGLFFRVFFLRICARPSCSLSRSFEKQRARLSCFLSPSFETGSRNRSLFHFVHGVSPDGAAVALVFSWPK